MQKKTNAKTIFVYTISIILILTTLVCFILLGMDVLYNKIFYEIDNDFYDYVLSMRSKSLNIFFIIITNFANPIVMGIISLILLFVFLNKKRYTFAIFLNIGLTALLNLSLKYIFVRSRPDISQSLIIESGYSFPSGHAMFAITFYGFLMFMISKLDIKKSNKVCLNVSIIILMLLICFSRIYLGVHYLSDVIGGILIASVYLIVFIYIFNRNNYNFREPATAYKKHSFLGGFKYAIRGIIETVKDENNILIQFSASMLTIMFAVFLHCTFVEWAILIIMCFLVVSLEMVNTAIENVCDRITLEKDEKIRKIKDISAGAVLMMSICSVIVAGVIFLPKIPVLF